MDSIPLPSHQAIVRDICSLAWQDLTTGEMADVAWAYYYFSIQFRESLKAARRVLPDDVRLIKLEEEECTTSNLSPWPGVALPDEKMNHDEFMRRSLALDPIPAPKAATFREIGKAYLERTRLFSDEGRTAAIASYEDGGLSDVFTAMLTFPKWEGPLLEAFEHFLAEHVRFDSDPTTGHGALSRHIAITDEVAGFWQEFRTVLIACVPGLLRNLPIRVECFDGIDVQPESLPIAAQLLDSGAAILHTAG